MHFCTSALNCTFFDRPKDVSGCCAAPEEFAPTAFLVLFLFVFFSRFPTCVCVCVCLCEHIGVCAHQGYHGATPRTTRRSL